MDTRQLKYILTIAECGSISKAADKLFISQSGLNQQLIRIEKEMGIPLFERDTHHLATTEAGAIFLRYAQETLNREKQMHAMISDVMDGNVGEIRVNLAMEQGIELFCEIFPEFHAKYPQIELKLEDHIVADQYKLPIDGFMTIRLEMLTELVDLFGGVEINVPMDVDYAALGLGDSVIHAGYQTLNGASMEFLLRARKIYPDGDIGRLNMQRQFYAALFRKLKSIGNIWDVAKLTPAVLNYMETNLSASDLISFAISMLKIDSSKIMICQMPVISGPQYNGQSLLYPARQADADLLNQYFRENTGPVDASQLNLCDNVIDLSGYTATDPNIQQMGGLMAKADDAQKNENLDGSNQVTDIMASESTAESESTDTDSTDTESQPAA